MNNNKCIYCGLNLRGKGCAYSPNKVHVVLEPNKCIYCGLNLRGKGCVYSPHGTHVMSSEFGLLQAESSKEHFIMKYLIEKLREPFINMHAYDLGIINEQGNQIKDATTEAERSSWSPLTQYVCKLKRIFSEKLELLNTDLYLESAYNLIEEDDLCDTHWSPEVYLEKVEKEDSLKKDLESILETYYNRLKKAENDGIHQEKVETILLKVLNDNISNNNI